MNVALIQPCGSGSSHVERHGQKALFNSCSKNSAEGTELQKLRSTGQEERRRKLGGGMRVLRVALLRILLRAQMLSVVALMEEIPARQEMGRVRVTDGEKVWVGEREGAQTARERIREPLENQLTGGEFRKSESKRSGKIKIRRR